MTTEEIIAWKKNFQNILEKARSKANRRYPSILEIDDDAEFGEYDINEAKRDIFIEGYLEAEKDNELTWEDIEKILTIIVEEFTQFAKRDKYFYEEVLRRFKEAKK